MPASLLGLGDMARGEMSERTYESVLTDIKEHPERHKHRDLNALNACCWINGALDLSLSEAHARYASQGRNGGQNCDVSRGPCSCGAWH